jgi:hypothetical protein
MMAAVLAGCGDAVPDKPLPSSTAAHSIAVASTAPRLVTESAKRAPTANPAQHHVLADAEAASWLEAVNQGADPQVRMAALEVWAAGAKESLDTVTYALVDPDEAVRTRAQELLEQELARR